MKEKWATNYKEKAAESFHQLKKLKADNNQQGFLKELRKILPGVKKFIITALNRAQYRKIIPKHKYRVEEIMDELYLRTYQRLDEVQKPEDFGVWLFLQAYDILAGIIKEEEFERHFVESIDKIDAPEWKEMEEEITRDADGDLVLVEELDDISYPKNDYQLDDVFVRTIDKSIMEKLEKELSADQVSNHAGQLLYLLPYPAAEAFDLSQLYGFDSKEVAAILHTGEVRAEEYIDGARRIVQRGFEMKYNLK